MPENMNGVHTEQRFAMPPVRLVPTKWQIIREVLCILSPLTLLFYMIFIHAPVIGKDRTEELTHVKKVKDAREKQAVNEALILLNQTEILKLQGVSIDKLKREGSK